MLKVIKDNIEYTARECFDLKTPFSFKAGPLTLTLTNDEKPVYFKRTYCKVGNTTPLKVLVFFGYKSEDKTILYYIENGKVIKAGQHVK